MFLLVLPFYHCLQILNEFGQFQKSIEWQRVNCIYLFFNLYKSKILSFDRKFNTASTWPYNVMQQYSAQYSMARFIYLEISIYAVKAFGVFRQLISDVFRSNKDTLQMGPGSLDLHPDTNDLVSCGQLLLPCGHFL